MYLPRTFTRFFALFLMLAFLPSCAQTEFVSHWWKKSANENQYASNRSGSKVALGSGGSFKVGKPYKIMGTWYTPNEDYDFVETGIASWYGDEFKGKPTANGEIFDPNAMTAAHRTLQMPSIIRVTNLENGKSIVVRVNDRGPFARGRVLDMSRRGAELLGYKNQGTARVRIQVLKNESLTVARAAKEGTSPEKQIQMLKQKTIPTKVASANTAPVTSQQPPMPRSYVDPVNATVQSQDLAPLPNTNLAAPLEPVPMHASNGVIVPDEVVASAPIVPNSIYVQVGSFTQASNAINVQSRLNDIGTVHVTKAVVRGTEFNRVRVGPIASVAEADRILESTLDRGFAGAKIIVE